MSSSELVTRMFNAMIAGDDRSFFSLVTDDFEFSGPLPVPVNAEGWFSVTRLIALAFPDIHYNFNAVEERANEVHFTTRLTGTHRGDLDLSPLGLKRYPATGKSFNFRPNRAWRLWLKARWRVSRSHLRKAAASPA